MCEKKRTKQHYCCSALFLHCLSGYGDIMFYCLINENRTVSGFFRVIFQGGIQKISLNFSLENRIE